MYFYDITNLNAIGKKKRERGFLQGLKRQKGGVEVEVKELELETKKKIKRYIRHQYIEQRQHFCSCGCSSC